MSVNVSLDTVLRCLDLVAIVRENQGITLDELARRTGIGEKAIVDDIIPTLMLCGAPPYMPHDYVSIWLEGDKVYVGFADHFSRPVTLLPIEVTSLHLALSTAWFPAKGGAALAERVRALREKIERALPKEQRVFLERSQRLELADNAQRTSPFLEPLRRAIEDREKVDIEYLSSGETAFKRRRVHPYGILVRDGASYVMSHDERRGHVVSFRLDRMRAVEATGETFERDPDFDLERYAKEGLVVGRRSDETVVVARVTGRRAHFVAETLDARQWDWKGTETLELRLSTSRPRAAVRWILGLGEGAEIVEPEEARALAREEITALRARHD